MGVEFKPEETKARASNRPEPEGLPEEGKTPSAEYIKGWNDALDFFGLKYKKPGQ